MVAASRLLLGGVALMAHLGPATAAWHDAFAQSPLLQYLPSGPERPAAASSSPQLSSSNEFRLRHVYQSGTHRYPGMMRRLDISQEVQAAASNPESGVGPFRLSAMPTPIQRLANRDPDFVNSLAAEARMVGLGVSLPASEWTLEEIQAPNITDKETVVNLAMMAADSYDLDKNDPEWTDVGKPYNYSSSFGWKQDGLRGHIFTTSDNASVVIAIKGTTSAIFDGLDTTTNDKINDNLFFGCCCGQQGQYTYRKVCDCATDTYTCNNTCVTSALKEENRYWRASQELYGNVTERYPDANVWVTGHSLGGSVSALLGLTVGVPVVTFEAPGEALAATRLGLPTPPDVHPRYHQKRKHTAAAHFGHTADPAFMGTCSGFLSVCAQAGYAMETQCHSGLTCTYDSVKDLRWHSTMLNHGIQKVLKGIYMAYEQPAVCEADTECVDCPLWKYYESNSTEPHKPPKNPPSSTKEKHSRTTTATCETYGWLGNCLDAPSTSYPHTTITSTLTTCSSYGWFGQCYGEYTTTQTETLPPPPTSATLTITSSTPKEKKETSTATSTMSVCHTPGRFWGCRDKTTTDGERVAAHEITPPPRA